MKKATFFTATLATIILMAFTSNRLHMEIYKIDTKLSLLEWYAEKVTGKHNGTIMFSAGEIKSDHGQLSGSFEVDMNSIVNTDIEEEEWKLKLENHLKNADFFDVVNFPKSTFVITSATPIQEANTEGFTHTVKGSLTIKNKTNEISFKAIINIQNNKMSCVGSAVVDRSKFDVKYGSKTFFADIGDKMIYDEFTMKFNVVANLVP